MTIALLTVGTALELLGIALVGASDVVPELRRAAVWVDARYQRLLRWMLKAIGRPKPVIHVAQGGGVIAFGGRGRARTGTSAHTLWGKVEYLLRESQRTQCRLDELEERLNVQHDAIRARLQRLNEELVTYVDEAIRTALAEYATARRWGIACLGFATILFVLAAVV